MPKVRGEDVRFLLWCLSFWLLSNLAFCQIDWRTTAHINTGIDIWQTEKFSKLGVKEMNPFAAHFLKRERYTEYKLLAVGSSLLLDDYLRKNKKGWEMWALIEMAMVWNNRKFGGKPVLWLRWEF